MKGSIACNCLLWGLLLTGVTEVYSQDATITINASSDKIAVSPYIYGSNASFDESAEFYQDAGLRFARMNGGNNATKYNWRKRISSHPDWYNNVYGNDWDAKSLKISEDHPNMQVMWAFQLLGRVASGTEHNFNDWAFNRSQYWPGVRQNLAGGGVPNTAEPDGKALVEGDIDLYTVNWPADSAVAILDHWFGQDGIGLNPSQFLYWSMDNEPDIWNGTHDDVMPVLISASDFVDRFIEVAKKARAQFPEIRICGPVTTSEWQWYKWGSESIYIGGKYYCWLEYFIKRIADEEKTSGTRLLDVFDLHNYPYAQTDAQALQNHRLYYDKNFIYPGANGLKTINGGWDESLTKEYVFQRINDWLGQYFGEGHGITLGISEWGPSSTDPDVCSVVYGSLLGTFANHGVGYLTPWYWEVGMWETLHLYSRYAKKYSVSSTSSNENTISAYTTVNEGVDSMTVIIVNRDMYSGHSVNVNITGFAITDGSYQTLQLSSLPAEETFISHTDNALRSGSVQVASNSLTLTVPSLSTTAVLLKGTASGIADRPGDTEGIKIYPNPAADNLFISLSPTNPELTRITVTDIAGRQIMADIVNYDGHTPLNLNISSFAEGLYLLTLENRQISFTSNFAVTR